MRQNPQTFSGGAPINMWMFMQHPNEMDVAWTSCSVYLFMFKVHLLYFLQLFVSSELEQHESLFNLMSKKVKHVFKKVKVQKGKVRAGISV